MVFKIPIFFSSIQKKITLLGYMSDPGYDIQLAFFFGAVKRDWLLILALQTTFNMHYFFM
jgi:hypothetical protein